jgi:hypothetical protein
MWNLKLIGIAVLAALSLCAGSAWYAYSSGRQSGMSQIQMQWDAERATQMAAMAEEEMKARQREQALQKLIDKLRRDRANEANRIAAEYQRTIDSLRNRPEARAGEGGVPEGAVAGVGCTGAGLSKSDSEFLVWLGSEAARTQAALNACVTAYDEVRRQVNGE